MIENAEIESEFYGGLYERVMKDSKKAKSGTRPKPEDFCLPRNQVELDKLLSRMRDCGIDDARAMEMIKERRMQVISDRTETKKSMMDVKIASLNLCLSLKFKKNNWLNKSCLKIRLTFCVYKRWK